LFTNYFSGGGGSVLPQKQLGRHDVVWRQGEFLWRHSGAWRHGPRLWRHRPLWRGATGRLARCRCAHHTARCVVHM